MSKSRALLWAVLGAGFGLIVIGFMVGAVRVVGTTEDIQATQLEGTPTGKRLLETADRIEDCTTPGGTCYERTQTQTAQAVNDIGLVTVLAASCAAEMDPERMGVERRAARIQRCVEKLLDAPAVR